MLRPMSHPLSRPMLKLVMVMAFALTTAAVGFAQRQPAGDRGRAGAGAGAGNDGSATTAADRNRDQTKDSARRARATFEVYKDKSGEYRWRLRATNTQILAMAAQGYSDKRSCLNAIESVKRDVADAPIEEKEAVAGKEDNAKDATTAGSSSGAGTGAANKKQAK